MKYVGMVEPKSDTNKSSRDNDGRGAFLHIFHRNPATWKLDEAMISLTFIPTTRHFLALPSLLVQFICCFYIWGVVTFDVKGLETDIQACGVSFQILGS